MKKNSLLLISERGAEGSSILIDLASSISDMVIWVASEPPDLISSILDLYGINDRVSVLSLVQSSRYRHVNVNNLSEVGILISKLSEGMEDFVVVLSAIPELLLIHGLEKTFIFLMNVIGKTTSQNRKFFGSLIKGAQSEREEIMISRLFSIILRYSKVLKEGKWERKLIFETPVEGLEKDEVPITINGLRMNIPIDTKEIILRELKNQNFE
ncbi:MAG: hypothetical protein H0Z28_00780 [Archaeoglobus sp.]|nr:hypothetical protein [Archaeoglobus sp.]